MGQISVKPKQYPCPIVILGQSVCTFIRGMPLAENYPRDLFIGGRTFTMPDGSASRFLKGIELLDLVRRRENKWSVGDGVLRIVQANFRPHPQIKVVGLGLKTYLSPSMINLLSPTPLLR